MDMPQPLHLHVNGEPMQLPAGVTVAALLARLGLDRGKVAVECREAIVPRSAWDSTALQHGDRLEIVHFIGGG